MAEIFDVQIMAPSGPVPGRLTLGDEDGNLYGEMEIRGNRTSFQKVEKYGKNIILSGQAHIPFGRIQFMMDCNIEEKQMQAVVRIPNVNEEIQVHGNRIVEASGSVNG